MHQVELEICTSDKNLVTDLWAEKIPDITVAKRMSVCDSAEWIPAAEELATIIITSSSTVALSLFSSWLYDRIKNKKPDKTTINNTNIVNNPKEITIIINNSIKIIQESEKD